MDDLAVARGGLEADRVGAFEDDDLVPGQRQRPRRRQPDDPGADHDRFDLVHAAPPHRAQGGILAETAAAARAASGRKFPECREFSAAGGWRGVEEGRGEGGGKEGREGRKEEGGK